MTRQKSGQAQVPMSQSEKADKQLQVITIWQGTQRPRKLGSDEMYNPSPMSTVKQKKVC